jgi:hypothetical protein
MTNSINQVLHNPEHRGLLFSFGRDKLRGLLAQSFKKLPKTFRSLTAGSEFQTVVLMSTSSMKSRKATKQVVKLKKPAKRSERLTSLASLNARQVLLPEVVQQLSSLAVLDEPLLEVDRQKLRTRRQVRLSLGVRKRSASGGK